MAAPTSADRFVAPLFIRRVGNDTPWGLARNLSTSGMLLETEERDTIGSEHIVSFVWGDDLLTCRVRVVRHDDDGIGLMFINPESTFVEALEEVFAASPAVAGRPNSNSQHDAGSE